MSYTGFCGEKHGKIHIKKEKKKIGCDFPLKELESQFTLKEQRLFDRLDHSQKLGSVVGVDWAFVF